METDKPEIKLTRKQERFCEEYVIDWNATQAAIRAGYSVDTAKEIGYENLTKPHLLDYIEAVREDISKLCNITAIRNVQELAKVAYSNMSDYYTAYGKLKPFDELTEEQKAAISEIFDEVNSLGADEGTILNHKTKIRLHDKLKALDMLNKMVGTEGIQKIEHSGIITNRVDQLFPPEDEILDEDS